MAVVKQNQQKHIDKFKIQTPKYKIKNIIRLTLKNITTTTENKKFDAKQIESIIFENIKIYNFRLKYPAKHPQRFSRQ